MARLNRFVIPAVAILGISASLLLLYQAQASLRERDEQVQRLRERLAQLEADVTRLLSSHPIGLPPDELEAYLSLPYKEFDATPGSGHRRFETNPEIQAMREH
jgi:type II secretory pathway component PulJ